MSRWTSRWARCPGGASIPDGAWVATGGFMLGRAPMALVLELIAPGRRGLKLISLPNPLPAELLVAGGLRCARGVALRRRSTSEGSVRPMPCLKRAIEQGRIAWREHDGYRVVQRLRAASMGLPFIPAPDADVSELAELEPPRTVVDPFTGPARAGGAGLLPGRGARPRAAPRTSAATSSSRTPRRTCSWRARRTGCSRRRRSACRSCRA